MRFLPLSTVVLAVVMEQSGTEWKRKFVELFQASQQHLEEGRSVFRTIKDNINVALLSCNLAKLHRLQARALAPAEKKEASLAEWRCYSKVRKATSETIYLINLFAYIFFFCCSCHFDRRCSAINKRWTLWNVES